MQLAGWRNQISNNALLNYLLQSKHAPWKLFSKCFYGCCSSGKDVLALFRCFQDCYYYSNNDGMCHVTKYCNTIGPHCTVRRDKACIRSSPDPSLSCGSGSGLRDYSRTWCNFFQTSRRNSWWRFVLTCITPWQFLRILTKKANVKFLPVTKDEYSHKKNHAIFNVRHATF